MRVTLASVLSELRVRKGFNTTHHFVDQLSDCSRAPMLARRACPCLKIRARGYASTTGPQHVQVLPDASLETFRKHAFEPAIPALLPRGTYKDLPAISNWFIQGSPTQLNASHFVPFGATLVPLEITHNDQFTRIQHSLSFFLECVNASTSTYLLSHNNNKNNSYFTDNTRTKRTQSNTFFSASAPTARVYLAQAPLSDLPQKLRDDVPTPDLVLKAGKGDVYDTSIWLGQAPTYTPLHRDPNPNLFVQLAGRKVVRLMRPRAGDAIFACVQERIGGRGNAAVRGEEMMGGEEKRVLEEEVWGEEREGKEAMWEAEVGGGDGLFIPKGWWHSIKGVGEGMTGSVNWWFR